MNGIEQLSVMATVQTKTPKRMPSSKIYKWLYTVTDAVDGKSSSWNGDRVGLKSLFAAHRQQRNHVGFHVTWETACPADWHHKTWLGKLKTLDINFSSRNFRGGSPLVWPYAAPHIHVPESFE